MKTIVLAGGCFWGVQAYYQQLKGISNVTVGYVNGNTTDPNYKDLKAGLLTHAEAVQITYDPTIISLTTILDHLFRFIDPTLLNQQGEDKGIQYRTGIYYDNDNDYQVANQYLLDMQKNYQNPIVVELVTNQGYYLAEEYHQDYLTKNPTGYCHVDLNLINEDEKQ